MLHDADGDVVFLLSPSNNNYPLAESPRYYLETVLYMEKLVDSVRGSSQYQ